MKKTWKGVSDRKTGKMSDIISRQAALEALRAAYWDKNIQSAKDDPCIVDAMTDWAIRQIKALPSAEPEIIHCQECENWDTTWTNDYAPNYHFCPMIDGTRRDDFYCADAERRTDG